MTYSCGDCGRDLSTLLFRHCGHIIRRLIRRAASRTGNNTQRMGSEMALPPFMPSPSKHEPRRRTLTPCDTLKASGTCPQKHWAHDTHHYKDLFTRVKQIAVLSRVYRHTNRVMDSDRHVKEG